MDSQPRLRTRLSMPLRGPGWSEVWCARASAYAAETAEHQHVLDAAERARESSLLRAQDRVTYRVAHVQLRRLLGERLGLDPADVVIGRLPCVSCGGPHGRPVVPGDPVHFSLSHSGDQVLIALAEVAVGVDIEPVATPEAVADVSTALHPRERAELAALPAADRPAAFSRCWTRKEAFLKGTGRGLSEDLSVTYLGAGETAGQPYGWLVGDLEAEPGYAAAFALRPA